MIIKKLIIKNFKKFDRGDFDFNEDVNIFVGNNNAGKSTLLEALDIVLNNQYRGQPFYRALSPFLFNKKAVYDYKHSKKSIDDLPEIMIEAYVSGVPEYRGKNNSLTKDEQGIVLKASFDSDFEEQYLKLVEDDLVNTIPAEFYKIEWFDFSGNIIKPIKKVWRSLNVDLEHINPLYGKNIYISNILNMKLSDVEIKQLELTYRELIQGFNSDDTVRKINDELDNDNQITNKDLDITINDMQMSPLKNNLQFKLDEIPFALIGKGEQSKIAIKLSLYNKSDDTSQIMIEEPENHLSHSELNELLLDIEKRSEKNQLFITTHSSYVINKLSINKICVLKEKYIRLLELENDVVKALKRLPGYDTLRVALAEKVVLVEGPSDELVLKKIYLKKNGKLPEDDGIDVIVVRGIGFDTFIEIGRRIGIKINVVTDNDGNYERISTRESKYKEDSNVHFISSSDNNEFSLEPSMIHANAGSEEDLDNFANIVLSRVTLRKYRDSSSLGDKKKFLIDWFKSENGVGRGKEKVDSAMRLFETNDDFKWPDFLERAFIF